MSIIKEWFKISKLRIAAYIRISKKEKEVNSISNQKDLIDYYIKDKEVVIVKDLSRLGRNYIEVGELLHSILPLYDVKLISINDNNWNKFYII